MALWRLVDEATRRGDPEQAARALFAGELTRFQRLTSKWQKDIRNHLSWMTAQA